MRAYLLSISASALVLAACGGAEQSSAQAETSDAGTIVLAQATTGSGGGGSDLSALPAAYQDADIAKGRQQWTFCAACHQIGNGTNHSVGPDLHGIFGKTAGTNATYPLYTPGMKASGIVWTPETIDTWIANPRDALPQTTMIFPGIAKEEDRKNLIAYLWTEAGGTIE